MLADGLLEPLLPGVVGPPGSGADPDLRLAAAVLALPERVRSRGTLAEAAAAWVWCGGPPPAVMDVAVPPRRSLPTVPAVAVHERRMPAVDVVVLAAVGGVVPLTTPTRTLVDLLRLLPPGPAPWAVSALVGLAGVTADSVSACLAGMPRARGVTRARTLASALPLPRAAPPGRPEDGGVSRSACR